MSDSGQNAPLSLTKQALLAIESLQAKLDASERARTEPIAIVGMGCRFPGGVSDAGGLWDLLREGKDVTSEVPAHRKAQVGDLPPNADGAVWKQRGGFLDDVDGFDADFFEISPREAITMDPQQRLVLEVAWEALEDAGVAPDRLVRSQTGVYIGTTTHDYLQLQTLAGYSAIDSYFGTGTSPSLLSGRVSYFLGLQGPSLTVDTACSSSLVTVHLACQALRAGECNLALAGGVNLLLSPELTVYFSKISALAPDGRCKSFDASADGFVRSEGCGIIVLKRLSDALANGDDILAVIRGSAVNQDGRSNGLTAPNGAAQEAVIERALSNANLAGSAVDYVEAHGSGTPLGDPIELRAIAATMATGRSPGRKLLVGSVKSNFGHVEAAAGIAGLMKVVVALHNDSIPAHLHCFQPTPLVPWDEIAVAIPTEPVAWPALDRPRYAGVSSFGLSGTNAHAIISDAPPIVRSDMPAELAMAHQLLTLSARSEPALRDLAIRYRDLLSLNPDLPVYDLCAAAAKRRAHHNHRLAIVGRTTQELCQRLEAFLRGESSNLVSAGQQPRGMRRKVVFVFPGHGSHWIGMGRGLLAAEPAFRMAMEACDRAIQREVGWSVIAELNADGDASRLDQVDVIQPLLFALGVSLATLWRSWGVEPDAVIGHSMGEVAAAYVSGALSLEEAGKVICVRSSLLRRQSGKGAMAVVELSVEEAERAIEGYDNRLSVAVSNGPRTTVISGEPIALSEVVSALEAKSIFCRRVNSDVAFHTPQMDALLPDLTRQLSGLRPKAASLPFQSTAYGRSLQGTECNADYWARNLRDPVQFWAAIQDLAGQGHEVFIEMSPHPILLPAMEEGLRSIGQAAFAVASLRRGEDDRASLLEAVGKVYSAGRAINFEKLYPYPPGRVKLPSYPWQREKYWLEKPGTAARPIVAPLAPLLGQRLTSALLPETALWETDIAADSFSYLKDHALFGEIVFPAAGYVEMALEAAIQLWGAGSYAVEDLTFETMLIIPDAGARTVQIAVARDIAAKAVFKIHSRESDGSEWVLHASGWLRRAEKEQIPTPQRAIPADGTTRTGEDHYLRMQEKNLIYGPAFRCVTSLTCFKDEVVATVQVPVEIAGSLAPFEMHPAVLDAAFQVLANALALDAEQGDAARGLYVPTAIGRLRLLARPEADMAVHAKLSHCDSGTLSGDIRMLDRQGLTILEVTGLQARRISDRSAPEDAGSLLYGVTWQPADIARDAEKTKSGTWVLVGEDAGPDHDLATGLRQAGYRTVTAKPNEFGRVAADLHESEILRGIVYLGVPDAPDVAGDGEHMQDLTISACLSILNVVRLLTTDQWPGATPLLMITRGGECVSAGETVVPIQSAIRGLGKTIALEQPSLRCKLIDMGRASGLCSVDDLIAELETDDGEEHVAWRGQHRFVARLGHSPVEQPSTLAAAPELVRAGSRSFRLETRGASTLDNLYLGEVPRGQPGPGQIEIEVEAAGLNFLDVLGAMGARPDLRAGEALRFGYECAGRVVGIGAGVTTFKLRDVVAAVSPNSLASHVIVPEVLACHVPDGLTIEQAASMSVAYVTALYALEHLGRLQNGESVLIHSAAGGVGLAAVEIARRAGAEIFATAGTEEKRDYLRGLGIQHVLDSRTLDFRDEILRITNGRGVDVVLNSLTGDAVAYGIGALAPCGRFLEIGKKDIYEDRRISLLPFRKNLSYFAIDLAWMAESRPDVVGTVLKQVFEKIGNGSLGTLPVNLFPINEVVEAFHLMAQGRHIGRIVVSVSADAVLTVGNEHLRKFGPGTYLITGGLGSLGLTLAEWMVDRGARYLVLLGRSGASEAANEAIAALRDRGATVLVAAADVADEAQLAGVLGEIDRTMPALLGVVHAAGLIRDGIALGLARDDFEEVMVPKIRGALNLHRQTQGMPLQFFLLYSSAASVIGSLGQANYAAANAFMDGLAHFRRAHGLPAQSINWGPWAAAGMAARGDIASRLKSDGIAGMSASSALDALEVAMRRNEPQVAIVALDVLKWVAAHPTHAGTERSIVAGLADRTERGEPSASQPSFADELRAAPARLRRGIIEAKLRELMAQALRLPMSRIDQAETLGSLGFDSLMALELRNRLQSLTDLKLSATMVWNYPTIPALATNLAEMLNLSLDDDEPSGGAFGRAATEASDLDALDESELSSVLNEELADLEVFLRSTP